MLTAYIEDRIRDVQATPDTRTQVYGNTGHLVLWEQPERVAADTTSFIESLGPNR